MKQYLEQNAPPTVKWEALLLSTGSPSVTDIHLPAVRAMHQAMVETWGIQPLYRREGGSIPVTAQMCDHLGIESVLTGFGLPDDNLHAPNEKVHLPTFYRGIETITRFFLNLGAS
jgi:acetylornithine deacetylase/succinyl-diaminopimelate desuccinylase-like protein